jgi:hypothetical protein
MASKQIGHVVVLLCLMLPQPNTLPPTSIA